MLSEATSNFMKENCLKEARKCVTLARLVGLQAQMTDVHLFFLLPDVCDGNCPCFEFSMLMSFVFQHSLNHEAPEILSFLNSHPNFRESIILAEVYGKTALETWSESVFEQVNHLSCDDNESMFNVFARCF